jgi:mono/diheme cytochrome c family protein
MKKRLLAWFLVPGASLLLSACQQQMADQPSFRPDQPSSFFPDGRSVRPLVPDTVARGHLRTDGPLFTGQNAQGPRTWTRPAVLLGTLGTNPLAALALAAPGETDDVEEFPYPVTRPVLDHGQARYMIYCVVCHDPLGTGRGKIVERGYTAPPSFHIERLRREKVGHFFFVITNGYGSMPDYRQQIPPRDRWAIVAYVRALQLSQHFPAEALSPEMRAQWENQDGATPAGRESR